MTIVMLLMLGTGVIMVASALDNTPIVETFQKIVSGKAINIGAANTTAAQTSNPTTTTSNPPTVTL
jgi:hypothetical protein